MGECRQQKHTQHAPSTKTECDYLNGWIKKRSHTQKSHPKVVNPRDIAGERKKKKKKRKKGHWSIGVIYVSVWPCLSSWPTVGGPYTHFAGQIEFVHYTQTFNQILSYSPYLHTLTTSSVLYHLLWPWPWLEVSRSLESKICCFCFLVHFLNWSG